MTTGELTRVVMPQLGESVVEGTVSRWLKQEGQPINAFEPLLDVSTDKVDTEIPAPATGVLLKIYVAEGQTVEKGTLLAVIGPAGAAVQDTPPAGNGHAAPAPQPAAARQQTASSNGSGTYMGHVTPVVARMAAEYGLDLGQIPGTGRGGRITKKDVEAFLEDRPAVQEDAPPWERPGTGDLFKPTVEYGEMPSPSSPPPQVEGRAPVRAIPPEPIPQGVPGELMALTAMRRAIAEHMVRSKEVSPHVTTVFEVDLAAVLAHREANKDVFARQGVNLTLTAYFAAASVDALRAVPVINARWTDEGIYLLNTIHLGMAVAVDDGLIVPVIRNAGDLNLLGLARTINDLAARARAKQLKPDEVRDGTFTISNHGVGGSLFATPIINQPQVGILGVGMMEKRVKVITDSNGQDSIAIRPCAFVSLTFDHRVADGATGDAFLLTLKCALESWK